MQLGTRLAAGIRGSLSIATSSRCVLGPDKPANQPNGPSAWLCRSVRAHTNRTRCTCLRVTISGCYASSSLPLHALDLDKLGYMPLRAELPFEVYTQRYPARPRRKAPQDQIYWG